MRFPDTPTFTGFNQPRRVEAEVLELEVEGRLPAALEGRFYRCGPDPRFPPRLGDDINLNGDGMVTMFRFAGGHVDFRSRYVRTEKFRLETAARRALFGAYRNPFTDDPAVAGRDRTTANTSVVFHAGRLFALKEDGLPHRLDPDTLETIGRHDYDGRMQSWTATAHPKLDPVSGEMISFGYEARGLATRDMAYQVIDAAGRLVREEFFEAPYVSFQHDFAVTERHVVFALMPTTCDLERLKAGGPHWVFEPGREAAVGIMRRDGSPAGLRWFRAPAQGIGHMLNAFSQGERVVVDSFVSARNQFPFVPNADGAPFDRAAAAPHLTRWVFDLDRPGEDFAADTLFDGFMEMPELDPRYETRRHGHGFCAMIDASKPLNVAGTIGLGWNTLARLDLEGRRMSRFYVGERTTCQEPQFVPRGPGAPEGDGWLLSVLTRFAGEPRTELVVLDTDRLEAGPVATIFMPFRLRGAIHGCWVPEEAVG